MFNDNGSFLLALFEFFLFFAWFMCLFWVLGDLFRSRDLGGGAKTLWVIFVILIPWLGILVYLSLGSRWCGPLLPTGRQRSSTLLGMTTGSGGSTAATTDIATAADVDHSLTRFQASTMSSRQRPIRAKYHR